MKYIQCLVHYIRIPCILSGCLIIYAVLFSSSVVLSLSSLMCISFDALLSLFSVVKNKLVAFTDSGSLILSDVVALLGHKLVRNELLSSVSALLVLLVQEPLHEFTELLINLCRNRTTAFLFLRPDGK